MQASIVSLLANTWYSSVPICAYKDEYIKQGL